MTANTPDDTLDGIRTLLRPFNRQGIELTPSTSMREDLALDSLAVMELAAAIEDSFDIVLPLNLLSEIHTLGDLATRVAAIREEEHA